MEGRPARGRLSRPLVSVVIPVFGRAPELAAALRSLEAEAALIHEVVVVDDASPIPVAVESPPGLAGRVRLLRLDANVGGSAARQAGVDHATGDLIAFLDSDDAWLPGKLAAQLRVWSEGQALTAVATGWQVVDLERGQSHTRIPLASADPMDFASGCWFCPGSTVLVPRAAFATVGPFDTRLRRLEDLDWFLRFALAGGRLVVAPVVGALIRRSRGQHLRHVAAARDVITARFAEHPGATGAHRRRLSAWLDAELAAANWSERRHLRALTIMARSLLRSPRRGTQLRGWWRTGTPALPEAEARDLLGIPPSGGVIGLATTGRVQ